MSLVLKYSIQKAPCIKRPQTYTYISSWRRLSGLHSRKHFLVCVRGNGCYKRTILDRCCNNIALRTKQNVSKGRSLSDHSSIFVSDRIKDAKSYFSFDHDLEERLSNTEELKANLKRRGMSVDIEQLKKDYTEFVKLDKERLEIGVKREDIAKQIAAIVEQQKKNKVKSNDLTSQMKSLSEVGRNARNSLKEVMVRYWAVEERMMLAALSLPNNLSHNVPDETKVLDEYFQECIPDKHVDHLEVLKNSGMVSLSNVGEKAYYFKGRLALLEQELINYFSRTLRSQNMIQMLAPEMFKTPIVEGSCLNVVDPASVYRLQHKQGTKQLTDWDSDHLFLHGASQLSFLAYFARTTMKSTDLPVKMFVVGSSYQPQNIIAEKLPGLFGVLQAKKVSMCSLCDSGDSSVEIMELFISILTDIYKQFELPFRLMSMPVSSLTAAEQNRIELQLWVPSLQNYLKLASVSMCGEYNTRRLMIRSADHGHKSRPLNMVHCDVANITQIIAILLEYGKTNKQW